jgi:hypothetical protein
LRILVAIALITAGLFGTALAAELNVEMFPLGDLKPGMQGIGKTVIRGTEIEEFDVEIIDLVPKGGFDGGPMVMARFTGEVVDFSNGIAGGYSGSPVYIDGKLLGAVSMAIPFTDTHIGGITPIQQMVKALPDAEQLDYSDVTVLPETDDNGDALDEDGELISYFNSYEEALEYNEANRRAGTGKFGAVLAKTPVYMSNVSPIVMDRFGDKFRSLLGSQMELIERPAGSGTGPGLLLNEPGGGAGLLLNEEEGAPPLAPGDAIAVSLIQGDIEAYAIGTLTYSDESGQFLCFGHPMMQEGDASFPVGKGYITWTFESIQRAFKDGVRLNTLGTMTKDHLAACGGTFNEQPEMIPVRLKIKDADLDSTKTMRFSVIRHKDFTPMLLSMGISQGAMEVLDRTPGGTLKLSYHIEGAGLKEPLRRTNYYSDDTNVISNAAFEVFPISGLLETNIYREVKITKVDLLLEITRNRVNASIDDAEITNGESMLDDEEAAEDEAVADEASEEESEADEPGEQKKDDIFGSSSMSKRQPLQDQAPADEQLPPELTADQMPVEPMMGDIPTFKPGDDIKVKVRLQPYRTDPVWREFSVTVPEDFPSGQTMVVVHGGGDLISFSELQGKGRSLFGMGPVIDIEEHDLDSILEQIMEWPLNNELLVTLQRPYDPAAAQSLSEDEEQPDDAVDAVYQMEWVIYNGFMLPVNIMREEDLQAMEAQAAALEEMVNGQMNVGMESGAGDDSDGECLIELPF